MRHHLRCRRHASSGFSEDRIIRGSLLRYARCPFAVIQIGCIFVEHTCIIEAINMHTTNYQDTFIAVADDCPAASGEVPPLKGNKKSVANLTFELLAGQPYRYTSDDVLFLVHAIRHDLTKEELPEARVTFFSKGQPCLRASPLTKRYGWGVHSDDKGRVALYGRETDTYDQFLQNDQVKVVKAMRSAR